MRQNDLTSTLSSGKPPSVFLSHNRDVPWECVSHTRNRPPVSGEFWGMSVMALSAGGGNVSASSVWNHVARCSLSSDELQSLNVAKRYHLHCVEFSVRPATKRAYVRGRRTRWLPAAWAERLAAQRPPIGVCSPESLPSAARSPQSHSCRSC